MIKMLKRLFNRPPEELQYVQLSRWFKSMRPKKKKQQVKELEKLWKK